MIASWIASSFVSLRTVPDCGSGEVWLGTPPPVWTGGVCVAGVGTGGVCATTRAGHSANVSTSRLAVAGAATRFQRQNLTFDRSSNSEYATGVATSVSRSTSD